MTNTCAACRKRPDVGLFCFRHLDALGEMLDPANEGTEHNPHRPDDPRIIASIPVLFGRLDAGFGVSGESSHSGVFKSGPPGQLQIMALRDGRSSATGRGPDDHDHGRCDDTCGRGAEPIGVPAVLDKIIARVDRTDIDGRLEQRPATGVESACAWLWERREWLAGQEWAGDLWDALRAIHGQLRGACGDPPPRPLGPCIKSVDEHWRLDDAGSYVCPWLLYLPEQAPKAPDEPLRIPPLRCGGCGWTYLGDELVLLVGQRVVALRAIEGAA